MKSYATPIALSAVLFITMLQPCPAPIISTLAIAGAGAALDMSREHVLFGRVLKPATPPQTSKADSETIIRFGGGVGVGAWAAGHGIGLERPPIILNNPTNSDPSLDSRTDITPFEQCASDGLNSSQALAFPANGSIIVADLPPSCMAWFEHYNLHPQIDQLNAAHGAIIAINGTAVELADLPPYVMTFVESSLLNGTHRETVPRVRRSLGAPKAFSA